MSIHIFQILLSVLIIEGSFACKLVSKAEGMVKKVTGGLLRQDLMFKEGLRDGMTQSVSNFVKCVFFQFLWRTYL